MDIIIPILYLLTGLIIFLTGMVSFRKRNAFPDTDAGYRIKDAMQDKDAWHFANVVAAYLCLSFAACYPVILLAAYFFRFSGSLMLLLYFIFAVFSILSIIILPYLALRGRSHR